MFDNVKFTNAHSHWFNFLDHCEREQIAPGNRIQEFKFTLQNEPRLWYEGKVFVDLADLQRRFIDNDSGVRSREGAVQQFRSTRYVPGESMYAYLAKLQQLANRLGYGNDIVSDQFRAGLPHDIRVQVTMARPANLDECAELAQRYADLAVPQTQPHVSFSLEATIDELRSQVESLQVAREVDRRSTSSDRNGRSASSERGRNRNRDRRSNRPNRSKSGSASRDRQRTRRENRCAECGNRNHFWRNCPDLKKKYMSKIGDQSFH